MNKAILIGAVASLLVLTGCATTEPTPTVTVTETAKASTTQSKSSVREDFVFYMSAIETPSYLLRGDSLDILVGQAQDVCSYIAGGSSSEDILWILTLADAASNTSDEVVDAFLDASVVATYTYCPEYEGFWD